MLSTIETSTGLTLAFPGWRFRVERSNPDFAAIKSLLQAGLTTEQLKAKCVTMFTDPLKGLLDWLMSHGLVVAVEGESLRINDTVFSRRVWEPFFKRIRATSGNPMAALLLQRSVGDAEWVTNCTMVWDGDPDGPVRLAEVALLKGAVKRGAPTYKSLPPGDTPCLVAYAPGAQRGEVLRVLGSSINPSDLLLEPVIKGNNRTYQCEEGDASGWLSHDAFDSLTEATQLITTLRADGSEGRIINTFTGTLVNV